MLYNIAVLLTCFNRKETTYLCLTKLLSASEKEKSRIRIKVFVTDDGSTDGTSEMITKFFPDVVLLKGDGTLFWTKGMLNSWNEALKFNFDSFLLLNDDTNVYESVFDELIEADIHSITKYGKKGIYIGSTIDSEMNTVSYGGSNLFNNILFNYYHLIPNGSFQECELGNGNIMLVTKDVSDKLGLLSNNYTHGIADYAYTLKARKSGLPVFTTKNYCGECQKNKRDKYATFEKLKFHKRYKYLFHPLGFAFKDNLRLMFEFFPIRLPIVIFGACIKVLSPQIYKVINRRPINH